MDRFRTNAKSLRGTEERSQASPVVELRRAFQLFLEMLWELCDLE